jgi:molybdopterin molybdotransferase
LGLPGNPVAALTTFIALARPALQILGGQTVKPPQHHRVITDFDYKKKAGRREFVRVHLTSPTDETGLPVASKHGRSGAGVLSSLVGADGFVEFPEDITHIKAGTPVSFLSFAEVFR